MIADCDRVLILTGPADASADHVCHALAKRGVAVVRLDPADFPQRLVLDTGLTSTGWGGELRWEDITLPLSSIRSIYLRRPNAFRFSDQLVGDSLAFAEMEAQAGFYGVLASLLCGWVNHPAGSVMASYKAIQLARAAALGLRPPLSIMTNDPDRAREFVSSLDEPALYKGIGRDLAANPDSHPSAATRRVVVGDIDGSVGATTHLFQEFVPKAYEVRVTVVGPHAFGAEIHAHSEASRLDWRTDYDSLEYRSTQVPNEVRRRIRALLGSFGLTFAALDFVVTHEHEWRFLELNPNGQWLWLAQELRLPIADAIADELVRGGMRSGG